VNTPQLKADEAQPTSRFASPLLPIFLIVVVDVLGFTIVLPLLPFYAEQFGASPTVVGTLVAMFAVCQLISGPILGQLSDRFGRRPVLLISQAGTLAGFIMMALAGGLPMAFRLPMLFLARAIDGATAGNLSTAQAYISDVTKPEERARSFAIIGVAFGFGFLVGPGITGLLAHYSYQAPLWAASALSFTSIVFTFFLLPRKEPVHQHTAADGDVGPGGKRLSLISWGQYGKYFHLPNISRLLFQWCCFSLSFSTFIAGFALFAERRYQWHGHPVGVTEIGYIFAFNGFIGIIMQGGVVGKLVKRFGERRVVEMGFLGSLVGYAAMGFTYTMWQLLAVMAVTAIVGAGLRPALTSLITQQAGRREQGVILGLTQSLTSLAQITAPPLAGFLIGQQWLTSWAIWAGVLSGVALLFESRASSAASANATV
jgi:DHA1 family tetracycline resistance protein-like MFS transporter